jgi:hypothetical protein
MNILFLLMLQLAGCANHIKRAKSEIGNASNCQMALIGKLHESQCGDVIHDTYRWGVMFRCHKEGERGKFWDNWVFRVSPANLQIDPDAFATVSSHTICIDKIIRVEAYHPSTYKFKQGLKTNKKD